LIVSGKDFYPVEQKILNLESIPRGNTMRMLDVRQVWNGIEIRLRWFARVYAFLLAIEVTSIAALFASGYLRDGGTAVRYYDYRFQFVYGLN
jgi:hypothetical protein